MMYRKKPIFAGVMLAALIAVPAVIRSPAYAAADPNAISPERAAALRECSSKANALAMQAWGSWPTYVYDNCMGQHGQKY